MRHRGRAVTSSPWLSQRPDRAWSELFFLAYSVMWMAVVAVVVLTGAIHQWGDVGYLVFSLAVGLPAFVGPLFFSRRPGGQKPLLDQYWLKFNVWVFLLVAFGTFIGTHYFFDLMGMKYAFPVTWTLQAKVVGASEQTVPVFMYPLTHAFLLTYHVMMVVLLRRVVSALSLGTVGRWIAIVLIAYGVAFAETLVMANDALSEYFRYADKARMLWLGSIGYSVYYVVSLPMISRLDDEPDRWPMSRVVIDALGASMIVLVGLEVWAHLIGPL